MFAESMTRTDITIEGISGTITKGGWDYLWISYKHGQNVVEGTHKLSEVPEYVMVERVYDSGDFSQLNIGTSRSDAGWQGPI